MGRKALIETKLFATRLQDKIRAGQIGHKSVRYKALSPHAVLPQDKSCRISFLLATVAVVALYAISLPRLAQAAEGNQFGGPIGGTDFRNAYLGPTGFYGAAIAGYGYSGGEYGNDGQYLNNLHTVLSAGIAAGAIEYVYPFKLFGGSFDSLIEQGYTTDAIHLGPARGNDSGALDVYTEVLGWSKYLGEIGGKSGSGGSSAAAPVGLTMKVAYSMIIPTGNYSRTSLTPPSTHVFFFIPNIGFTYLTRPNRFGDGFSFDVHSFGDLEAKDTTTDYTTGPVIDIDFALSDNIGRFQFGMAGSYAWQLLNDEQGGQVVNGNGKKFQAAYLGPAIAYDIPSLKANVKLKVQLPIAQHNYISAERVFLVWGMKF